MELVATASQTVGPFFRRALDRPALSDLTAKGPAGERIRIAGRVLDGDGAPVPDALIEIWQANAAGRYAHPEDAQDKPLDDRFLGFGRACTDLEGRYAFLTIRPGPVPGAGGALQAPHVAVSIFARGLLRRLVTRIYFDDEHAANEADPLLAALPSAEIRRTMIAVRSGTDGQDGCYRFDIVLQGEGETAFLDI